MEKISFVVQGPIISESSAAGSQFSTQQVLLSIRRFYPDAEIVLSTWRYSEVSRLSYDVLVLSDDPGGIPHKNSMVNCNRMIVSTTAGIRAASHAYVVKTRTDIPFTNNNIYSQLEQIQPIHSPYGVFGHVVLSSIYYVRDPLKLNLLFHPSDIFLIGKKEDLRNFFDMPKAERSTFVKPDDETKLVPEQYLFTQLILKTKGINFEIPGWGYVNLAYFINSERFLFNNFLFFDTEALGFVISDRLSQVFMPEGNYSLDTAQKLTKMYRRLDQGHSLQSMFRVLQYLKTYHLPYILSGGWKNLLHRSINKLKRTPVHGN